MKPGTRQVLGTSALLIFITNTLFRGPRLAWDLSSVTPFISDSWANGLGGSSEGGRVEG